MGRHEISCHVGRRSSAGRRAAAWPAVLALALSACGYSYTAPVVASFENYNEVFSGALSARTGNGNAYFEMTGLNTGIQCRGESWVTRVRQGCIGQSGRALFYCDDGRRIDAVYTARNCTAGSGKGTDGRRGRFRFAFGMSNEEAAELLKLEQDAVRDLPALPVRRER